jgi:hypothetical protein
MRFKFQPSTAPLRWRLLHFFAGFQNSPVAAAAAAAAAACLMPLCSRLMDVFQGWEQRAMLRVIFRRVSDATCTLVLRLVENSPRLKSVVRGPSRRANANSIAVNRFPLSFFFHKRRGVVLQLTLMFFQVEAQVENLQVCHGRCCVAS